MTEEQIGNILRVIGTANVSEEQRGSATADVLQLAAETFTKQVFTSLLNAKPNEIKREEEIGIALGVILILISLLLNISLTFLRRRSQN